MTSGTRTGLRWTLIIVAMVLAFRALSSADPLTEVVGAVVLAVLAGWLMVHLFRARNRFVR